MSELQALTDCCTQMPAAFVDEMEFYSTTVELEPGEPVIPLKNGGYLDVTKPFVSSELIDELAFTESDLQGWRNSLRVNRLAPAVACALELRASLRTGYWKQNGKFVFQPKDLNWLSGTWQFMPASSERPPIILSSVPGMPGYVKISIKGTVGWVDFYQPQLLHNVAKMFSCNIEQAADALRSITQWTLIDAPLIAGSRAKLSPLNPHFVKKLENPFTAFVTHPEQACFGGIGAYHPATGFRMASLFVVTQQVYEQLHFPENATFFDARWVVESRNTGKVVTGPQLREELNQKGRVWIHRMP
jgi:hypothetical protein